VDATQLGHHAFNSWNDWYDVHKQQELREQSCARWKHCSIDVCFFVANDVISFACCFSNNNDDFVQVQTRCKVINVTMLEGEGLTMLYVIQLAMQHE
jgi:hypothetical protein